MYTTQTVTQIDPEYTQELAGRSTSQPVGPMPKPRLVPRLCTFHWSDPPEPYLHITQHTENYDYECRDPALQPAARLLLPQEASECSAGRTVSAYPVPSVHPVERLLYIPGHSDQHLYTLILHSYKHADGIYASCDVDAAPGH